MRTTNNFSNQTPRKSSLNCFTAALSDICRAQLLREKWLLVPSYRVGQQWLDLIARAGQPLVNVRLHTIVSFALELAVPTLAAGGPQLLSPLGRVILVSRLLRELPRDDGYLANLRPSVALAERLVASMHDFRLAGLQPSDLDPGKFEVAAKGREILGLLHAYQKALDKQHLIDDADLLRLAFAALPLPADIVVLLPADLELPGLGRDLLDALPDSQRITLPVDETPASHPTDAFGAIGESNEVREVLRRCLANGWPLDQVELLHADPVTYVPLVFEIAEGFGVPVTFADGIPVRYSRPGRALAAWMAWIANDFQQSNLVAMIQDGLLDGIDRDLASALRVVPIGLGRERYVRKLDEHLAVLDRQLTESTSTDEDGEQRPDRGLRHQHDSAKILRERIEKLLAISHTPLESFAEFLQHHAHCANELDNYARDFLLERIGELRNCGDDALDIREFVQSLLRNTRVLGLGPRPGCLHVASIETGGHSGRPHTFIVGLDADRFPAARGQDPVLLDDERKALSPHLTTAAAERARSTRSFERLLARLRSTVTMSYSSRDIARDIELFPSPVIAAQVTAALAPRREEESLAESEWWLWRLCSAGPVGEPLALIGSSYPWLGRGIRAAEQRSSDAFTAYDGFVPEAGPDLDPAVSPDRQFSPRRLETLGTCPLRYFFHYALGLESPDELEMDPHRWLSPAEFGQLLHEVFHRFLRDGGRIDDVLRERIEHYREKFPAPSEGVFRRERRRLERAARIFESENEVVRRRSRPIDFEKGIDGVAIELEDGSRIHVRGRIDRVDEMDGKLALWDYKTGSTFRFRRNVKDPFDQGRILQHALYIALATAHYGRPVAQFGYLFPTDKGHGEPIVFTPAELTDAPRILARLRGLVAHGTFPATDKADDCAFCDCRSICRDVETITTQSAQKKMLAR